MKNAAGLPDRPRCRRNIVLCEIPHMIFTVKYTTWAKNQAARAKIR